MAQEVMVKSREVFYRGQSLENLKKMSVRECAKYLPSRSRRSVLRNFQVIEKFIQRCENKVKRGKKIKTHLRDIVITPSLVGINISIFNGRSYNDVMITPLMIGHRLGEFSLTRVKVAHGAAGIGATKGSKTEKK